MVAVLVIYIVLGVLYESLIHPITILSGLPSAMFGALLTLKLFHLEVDLYAFVGLIMLFGIVKKNAIMMIDFALEAQRKEGKNPFDAIYEGCLLRFRPIMMTTLAALFGTLPIALGAGAGAESRRPSGTGGGWRVAGFAVADALHHSSDLSLHGIVPELAAPRQGRPAARDRRSASRTGSAISPHSRIRPWRIPIATASARLDALSLVKMEAM